MTKSELRLLREIGRKNEEKLNKSEKKKTQKKISLRWACDVQHSSFPAGVRKVLEGGEKTNSEMKVIKKKKKKI